MFAELDILNASILIVDDQKFNVAVVDRILRNAGYTSTMATTDPLEVCALHRDHHSAQIDQLTFVASGLSVQKVVMKEPAQNKPDHQREEYQQGT